jgi:adenylosuccinate lyase
MYCVSRGGDRQVLHEEIRRHSVETAVEIKNYGKNNTLFDKILADKAFNLTKEELDQIANPALLTGRAKEQTEEFLANAVLPVLEANKSLLGVKAEINI